MGQNLIDKHQCAGSEEAVQSRLVSIADQWEFLTHKTAEKSMKLKEANKQRTYIAAVKDLDFWLGCWQRFGFSSKSNEETSAS